MHARGQQKMQNSDITANLLGPFHSPISPLQLGMSQQMQYTYKDSRPCYLTAEEKDKHRYDINMGEKQSRYKNTLQLKETLKTAGILDPKGIITQL